MTEPKQIIGRGTACAMITTRYFSILITRAPRPVCSLIRISMAIPR
jgi:hypothetical protein